jgi:MFS family permease
MNRKIFVSLFLATLVAMLGLGVIDPILPRYAKSAGASGIEIGVIFAGFALSRGLFAPIIGELSDRRGRKKLMVGGLVLSAAASIAFVFATSVLPLILLRILQGFATVLVTPVAQAYVGDLTPVGREGEMLNLFYISLFTGAALGPGLGGYLNDRFSIAAPFYAMAALSLLALLLILVLVPESSAREHRVEARRGEAAPSILRSLAPVFRDRPMLGIMAYMSSRGFYRWGFNTFFPLLAVRAAGMSLTQVGLVLSLYMLTGSVIQYPFGLLVDRHPRWKVGLIVVGGGVSALAMCAVAAGRSLVVYVVLALTMGIASAVSRASAVAIRTERGRIHGMGATTGAFTTSFSLGQVLGPIAFGIVADVASIPAAFVVGGVVGLVGTVGGAVLLKPSLSARTA